MNKLIYGIILILFPCCTAKIPEQPERLADEEIAAFRDAAMKMTQYIILEDSAYYFTISKETAVENGIPEKYYERLQQELDYTNYLIREYNSKGIPIAIDDYWIEER